jgi:hypothetical protein
MIDRLLDAAAILVGDERVSVDHIGHSLHRNTGPGGDVLEGGDH